MVPQQNIYRENNKIIMTILNHPVCVSNFIRCIRDGKKKGMTSSLLKQKIRIVVTQILCWYIPMRVCQFLGY